MAGNLDTERLLSIGYRKAGSTRGLSRGVLIHGTPRRASSSRTKGHLGPFIPPGGMAPRGAQGRRRGAGLVGWGFPGRRPREPTGGNAPPRLSSTAIDTIDPAASNSQNTAAPQQFGLTNDGLVTDRGACQTARRNALLRAFVPTRLLRRGGRHQVAPTSGDIQLRQLCHERATPPAPTGHCRRRGEVGGEGGALGVFADTAPRSTGPTPPTRSRTATAIRKGC
jgi:hypothetical protein